MKKSKGSRISCAGRKPIRPIERQKMRPWLVNLLLNEDVPSMQWENKKAGTFKIAWRHAARQGWNPSDDADLFERWARHTGKFIDGDEPDPKRWKANFRCALNSLPDVEELKDKSVRKGNNAYKIYRFLDEKKMKSKNRNSKPKGETHDYIPKRISKRLQDKPHRRFIDSEDDYEEISDECPSPNRDSDVGSEREWVTERGCRLSTDSSELPVFEKICRDSDLQIFKAERNGYGYGQVNPDDSMDIDNYYSFMSACHNSSDDDRCSTETDMTEEELVELILNVESPQPMKEEELHDEPVIDIWSAVAADVTIGGDGEEYIDLTDGCAIITETENVITQQILINNPDMCYTSLDPSLV